MQKEFIDIDKITREYLFNINIKQGILYYINRVNVQTELSEFSLEGLQEAIFFGDKYMVKVFKQYGKLKAVKFSDEIDDEIIKTSYKLIENKSNGAKIMKIKRYIKYDEDDQAYVSFLRPFSLE